MKKPLLALLLLVLVLSLPSAAAAIQPSGTLVMVPDNPADAGAGPAPRSWLFDNIFIVRAHVCRVGASPCGPDPLVASGAAFSGFVRIWVPFPDTYTIYAFVSDTEGTLLDLKVLPTSLLGGAYFNFLATFAPFPSELYKFHALVIAGGSGLTTFSNFYQFRQGGPNSSGCCP